MAICLTCEGCGWVCEAHLDRPWGDDSDSERACHCGGAGAPCPACNRSDGDHEPRMPPGFTTIISRDGPVN
jgi:hypothetical protein